MYASIAAAQDWDAIYAYTYLDFSARWDADHLLGFFDLAGNPAPLSFLPVAALTFRQGLVAPATTVARLALPDTTDKAPPLVGEGALSKLWTSAGLPPSLLSSRRLEIVPSTKHAAAAKTTGANQPLGPIVWNAAAPAPTFTVDAPALRVAAGKIAGTAFDVGDVHFAVGDLPRGDASIALVALDALPLALSKEMLLVAVARVENTAMKWNAERTGLTSWGHGPAVAEYVPLTVTVPWPQLRAERLDPAGGIAAPLAVTAEPGGRGRSVLHLDREPSLWFLLRR
jgi:hypothetical protein